MPHGCCTTCTARARRTSTPIRTWSPDSVIRRNSNLAAALAGPATCAAWPGCSPSLLPRSTAPTTRSRSGIARCGPRQGTGCCRTQNGRRLPSGSCTGLGSPRRTMTSAVRWVAVRHAPDHIHLVATLARQDRLRPKMWNDFLQVREACQEAERQFGLRATAPADRTAARRPTRAESEQAARRGWAEPPRVTLRREVCTAAAGARHGTRVFHPPGPSRCAGPSPPQHSPPRPGDRVRRRPPVPHQPRTASPSGTAAGNSRQISLCRSYGPAGLTPTPATRSPDAAALPSHAIRAVLRTTVAPKRPARQPARRSSSLVCAPAACWSGNATATSTPARSRDTP